MSVSSDLAQEISVRTIHCTVNARDFIYTIELGKGNMSFAYPQPPTPAARCAPSCSCANLACQIRKLECELQQLKQRVAECCDDQPTPEEIVCDVFNDASAAVPASDATALYKNADNSFTVSTPNETQCSVFNGASAGVPADQNATVLYKNTDNTFVKATSEEVFCSMVNASDVDLVPNPENNKILMKREPTNEVVSSSMCQMVQGYLFSNVIPFLDPSSNPDIIRVPVGLNGDCNIMTVSQVLTTLTTGTPACTSNNLDDLRIAVYDTNLSGTCYLTLTQLKALLML